MAKWCESCLSFRGKIVTCKICGKPVCETCRATISYCKDCFMLAQEKEILGDYKNEKKINVVTDISF